MARPLFLSWSGLLFITKQYPLFVCFILKNNETA